MRNKLVNSIKRAEKKLAKDIREKLNPEILASKDFQILVLLQQMLPIMEEIENLHKNAQGVVDDTTPVNEAYLAFSSQAAYYVTQVFNKAFASLGLDNKEEEVKGDTEAPKSAE